MSDEKDPKWMEHAAERMKEKGTVGSYGKASSGKIKKDMAKGGAVGKKAAFAKVAAKVARKRGSKK